MIEDKTYKQALEEAGLRHAGEQLTPATIRWPPGVVTVTTCDHTDTDAWQQLCQRAAEWARQIVETVDRCIVQPIVRWLRSPQVRRFFARLGVLLRQNLSTSTRHATPRQRSTRRQAVYQRRLACQ